MNSNRAYFDGLQAYRGIAALLVVVHHTYGSFSHFLGLNVPALRSLAAIGKFGVDFFFVLSGFIIAYTTYQQRGKLHYLKHYAMARALRVYTPYLPISVALLLLYHLLPGLSAAERDTSLITSLFLVPHGLPALSVAWTLVFEVLFYVAYSLNFIDRRLWLALVVLWIPSICTVPVSSRHCRTRKMGWSLCVVSGPRRSPASRASALRATPSASLDSGSTTRPSAMARRRARPAPRVAAPGESLRSARSFMPPAPPSAAEVHALA